MKITLLPALAAACALSFAAPLYAQRGHGPQSKPPKAATTHVQGGAAARGGQVRSGTVHGATTHATTPRGPHTSAKPPKTTTHGAAARAATAKKSGAPKSSAATTTAQTTRSTKTATTTATTTGTTTGMALTPLQQKLQKNTNLAAKLQSRLPAGTTVQQACIGFRNLGQFVAAVNVSNNLGIPFADLKARMLGDTLHTTPDPSDDVPMSLGQAIHALRPSVDSEAEATTAERQAAATVAATTSTTTTAATTTTARTKRR